MKKMFFIQFILFCALLSAVPAFALMKNEPEGFRGIPWFASPENAGLGLYDEYRMTVTTVYRREENEPRMGAARLSKVEYIFLDNAGLVQVCVEVDGAANVDALIKACTENWGEPKKDRMCEIYTWVGKKVRASLNVFTDRATADLDIEVKKRSELIEEEQVRQAQESKKDF